jgi:hypothetical protein
MGTLFGAVVVLGLIVIGMLVIGLIVEVSNRWHQYRMDQRRAKFVHCSLREIQHPFKTYNN